MGPAEVKTMKLELLILLATVLLLAAPAQASAQGDGPGTGDLPLVERGAQFDAIPAQEVVNAVQAQLRQAEIAALLSELDAVVRGTGSISSADAGRIEEEITRQKQIWYEAYRKSLAEAGDGESPGRTEELDESFDALFEGLVSGTADPVSPETFRLVYLEYDRLSQSFQQLKLARFLAANREGVSRYKGPQPDRLETARMSREMEETFIPGYTERVQDGVSNLRKVLVASSATPAGN